VGKDYAAVVVLSRTSGQISYCWRSSTTTPVQLAHHVLDIATRYNAAMVLCESNNHGHSVLSTLSQLGYRRLWVDARGKPWTTTQQSKLRAFEALRTWVLNEAASMPVHLAMEVASLRLTDAGTPSAPDGMHDDLAMALALACTAAPSVPIPQRHKQNPLRRDMMQHLQGPRSPV